ncbi:FadR/GntR family transcriptional regulator [Gynuella sp.]|uniref:FadR/GntR family transcriptional regulator n=1 Tax=Gynuella sp. TaxID=2969146 RepID=UPI003D1229E1
MPQYRSEEIRDLLLQQLQDGAIATGERLPSERQLAQQYTVSRPIVREALQALKSQGWVISKRGGGTYAANGLERSAPTLLPEHMDRNIDLQEELLEYRYALEGQTAYLAAQRASEADLKKLERAFLRLQQAHQLKDAQQEATSDAIFHLAIAEASQNRVLHYSLQTLFDLLRQHISSNIGSLSRRPETRLTLIRQHRRIFDAIHRRQPERAREVVYEHLDFVKRILTDLAEEQQRVKELSGAR